MSATIDAIAAPWAGARLVGRNGERLDATPAEALCYRVTPAGGEAFCVALAQQRAAYAFTTQTLVWNDWAVFGFGTQASLVSLDDARGRAFDLGGYFCALHACGPRLHICFSNGVLTIDSMAAPLWRRDDLAIDGVVLDHVNSAAIIGAGEWDPPGGWRRFRLDAATGASLSL